MNVQLTTLDLIENPTISLLGRKYVVYKSYIENTRNPSRDIKTELKENISDALEIKLHKSFILAIYDNKSVIIYIIAMGSKIQEWSVTIPIIIKEISSGYNSSINCTTVHGVAQCFIYDKSFYFGTEMYKNDNYNFRRLDKSLIIYDNARNIISIKLLNEKPGVMFDFHVFNEKLVVLESRESRKCYEIKITGEEPDDKDCGICMANDSNIFLIPCGHKLCHKCYISGEDVCPFCRQEINNYLPMRLADNMQITDDVNATLVLRPCEPKPEPSPNPSKI